MEIVPRPYSAFSANASNAFPTASLSLSPHLRRRSLVGSRGVRCRHVGQDPFRFLAARALGTTQDHLHSYEGSVFLRNERDTRSKRRSRRHRLRLFLCDLLLFRLLLTGLFHVVEVELVVVPGHEPVWPAFQTLRDLLLQI